MTPVLGEKYWYTPKQLLVTFNRQRDTKWVFSYGKKGEEILILTAVGLTLLLPPTEEQLTAYSITSKEGIRRQEAKRRGAVYEPNEAFKGNRYDPSIDSQAAQELRSIALDLCISCQDSKRDELAVELGIPLDYIFRNGEASNSSKFEIVFVNTRQVKELCDRLKIYTNPYAFFGKSYENVAVCSRALGEELMAQGMVPHRFTERQEMNG